MPTATAPPYTDADNRTTTYTGYNVDGQLAQEDWYDAPASGVRGAWARRPIS